MRTRTTFVTLALLCTLAFPALAGNLTPPGAPGAGSNLPTLTDIYNQLDTGTTAAIPGSFQEPATGPGAGTGKSLSEIKARLPVVDNTNGATVGDVLSGKTFWGLQSGTWGVQTGTLNGGDTYSISGTIALNGAGQSGVIVALTGAATNAAITAADGTYSFAGLPNGSSYTVTPSKSGYSFTPASLSGTVSGANVTGQNFTDIITRTYSCSGTLSPLGRWCDNGNGTVRDMTSGLIWLQDAGGGGLGSWWNNTPEGPTVFSRVSTVANGNPASLSDGSAAGDWRIPTKAELVALTTGTEAVLSTTPRAFYGVQANYWTSTSSVDYAAYAWYMQRMTDGYVALNVKIAGAGIWPVRGGQ